MKSIKLKINKVIPGYSIGQITTVFTDNNGTPLSKFWRDRLHDAETDNCVEITKTSSKKSSSKESDK